MAHDLSSLSVAAVSLGFLHCVGGPDHYLPFVAMSRVGVWSLRKTILVTALCGVGHIAGTAILGILGVAAGLLVYHMEASADPLVRVEHLRGEFAAWLLVALGAAYAVWGCWRATHPAKHHHHGHASHHHGVVTQAESMTPWILFTIFVFGPCEPLIPLLIYPAAQASLGSALLITALFGITTLLTMTVIVVVMYHTVGRLPFQWLSRYSHTLAGFVLAACGIGMLLGL